MQLLKALVKLHLPVSQLVEHLCMLRTPLLQLCGWCAGVIAYHACCLACCHANVNAHLFDWQLEVAARQSHPGLQLVTQLQRLGKEDTLVACNQVCALVKKKKQRQATYPGEVAAVVLDKRVELDQLGCCLRTRSDTPVCTPGGAVVVVQRGWSVYRLVCAHPKDACSALCSRWESAALAVSASRRNHVGALGGSGGGGGETVVCCAARRVGGWAVVRGALVWAMMVLVAAAAMLKSWTAWSTALIRSVCCVGVGVWVACVLEQCRVR